MRLVQEYLEVYQAALEVTHRWEKLEEELARVSPRRESPSAEAKGVKQ